MIELAVLPIYKAIYSVFLDQIVLIIEMSDK